MSVTDTSDQQRGGRFTAQISDETFNFRAFTFNDRKVTAGQLADAVGAHPIEDHVFLAQKPSFELETMRPNEDEDLSKVTRFFVIKGDGTHKFFVNGLSMEWPKNKLSGRAIRTLVGKEDENVELLLEREDTPDQVIADEQEVNINERGVEKFKTRKKGVTIYVEGVPHAWDKPKISYAEVVTLEDPDYPQHPEIDYSVSYTDGVPAKPVGDLAKGESVKVKDRMKFDVSPTGES